MHRKSITLATVGIALLLGLGIAGGPLTWGTLGDWPGGLFNIHGASIKGNLYIAKVANGRAQKFHPRAGANPEFVVGKSVYSAWK